MSHQKEFSAQVIGQEYRASTFKSVTDSNNLENVTSSLFAFSCLNHQEIVILQKFKPIPVFSPFLVRNNGIEEKSINREFERTM